RAQDVPELLLGLFGHAAHPERAREHPHPPGQPGRVQASRTSTPSISTSPTDSTKRSTCPSTWWAWAPSLLTQAPPTVARFHRSWSPTSATATGYRARRRSSRLRRIRRFSFKERGPEIGRASCRETVYDATVA